MDLELNHSVPNRDIELEAELLNRYYKKYVDLYVEEMDRLAGVPDFVRDDSFNGVQSCNHIIYKLKTGADGGTVLMSKDGNRGYEFVIEFDREESAYGIYYGCKGLIKRGNQEEEIKALNEEWEGLKNETTYVLNNTFPGKNFYKRYKLD